MKETIAMDQYTCDGCHKVTLVDTDGEPPYGFHLTASYIHAGGGDGADDIYACSDKCIRKAVIYGLARDDRAD